jgi:hypothetical protein
MTPHFSRGLDSEHVHAIIIIDKVLLENIGFLSPNQMVFFFFSPDGVGRRHDFSPAAKGAPVPYPAGMLDKSTIGLCLHGNGGGFPRGPRNNMRKREDSQAHVPPTCHTIFITEYLVCLDLKYHWRFSLV